uniref:Uncharacterized protein n=1 Tax=Candidatus Kentrum sp. DK TaxID=2126562 RepID=A0A450RVK7_9GAMM|nr:MAG: hypothetical protein BECKDK2373C_GA0170839_100435 [Candidatus Kentron sp. DK]
MQKVIGERALARIDATAEGIAAFHTLGLLRGAILTHPALSKEDFDFAFGQGVLFCWEELIEKTSPARFPDFALSHGFNLVRGILNGLTRRGKQTDLPPFVGLLRGFLDGDAEIKNFHVPLGLDARFVSGHATARRWQHGRSGAIYSVFATNCRIEEVTVDGILSSRYFDFSCVIQPADGRDQYHAMIDIQSDDYVFGIKLTMALPTKWARGLYSARIVQWKMNHKHYDFGEFSVENIYPVPTLHRSKTWLPMARAYTDRIVARAGAPNVTNAMRLLMHYVSLE